MGGFYGCPHLFAIHARLSSLATAQAMAEASAVAHTTSSTRLTRPMPVEEAGGLMARGLERRRLINPSTAASKMLNPKAKPLTRRWRACISEEGEADISEELSRLP